MPNLPIGAKIIRANDKRESISTFGTNSLMSMVRVDSGATFSSSSSVTSTCVGIYLEAFHDFFGTSSPAFISRRMAVGAVYQTLTLCFWMTSYHLLAENPPS